MLQLTDESRKKLHRNLTERILSAEKHIKEISAKETKTDKDEADLQYLHARRHELTLSVLVVYNTNRISEDREEKIKHLQYRLQGQLGPNEKIIYNRQLTALKKSKNCKTCHGRGWTGFKEKTGEYAFCTCVLNTMEHYIKFT